MNDAMLPLIKRIDDARDELYRATEELERICDHRDEHGEKRVVFEDYDYRALQNPLLCLCAFCGKEL